jgi:ribonuclease D
MTEPQSVSRGGVVPPLSSSSPSSSSSSSSSTSSHACDDEAALWAVLNGAIVEPPPPPPAPVSTSTVPSFTAATVPRHVYRPITPPRPELFIDRPEQVTALTRLLLPSPILALDTEFLLFPSYRSSLQVLQIASPSVIAAVDCQLLMRSDAFRSFIESILPKTLILHSAKGDMEVLYDLCQRLGLHTRIPHDVFDTQIAAAYVGYGSMIGYARLLNDMYGVSMNKSQTMTDWSKRPLTLTQLEYCLGDVRHLHAMREDLMSELKEKGRLEWAEAELRCLNNELLYAPTDPGQAWRGVFSAKKLIEHSDELSVLRELCRLREVTCKERDMATNLWMRDENMYGLAVQMPATNQQLETAQGVKEWVMRKYGRSILKAIKKGREASQSERSDLYHRVPHQHGGRLKEGLYNLLNSRVQSVAGQHTISPFHLAPRQELFDLASASPQAITRVKQLTDQQLRPAPMISNFWGVRSELLPFELSTAPRVLYQARGVEEVKVENSSLERRLSVESEVEMLTKLKVLSGWRRVMVGNDLLAIAEGQSLTWDQLNDHTTLTDHHHTQQHHQHHNPVQPSDPVPPPRVDREGVDDEVQERHRREARLTALTADVMTGEELLTSWMAGLTEKDRVDVWAALVWLVQRMEGVVDSTTTPTSRPAAVNINERVVSEVRQLCERIAQLTPTTPTKRKRSSTTSTSTTARRPKSPSASASASVEEGDREEQGKVNEGEREMTPPSAMEEVKGEQLVQSTTPTPTKRRARKAKPVDLSTI